MVRTAYVSLKTRAIGRAEMEQLLHAARTNNEALGVTGILLNSQQFFFQILEGSKSAVEQVYRRIAKDNRHENLWRLAYLEDVEERLFSDWSMAHYEMDREGERFVGEAEEHSLADFLAELRALGNCETLRYLEEFVHCHWSGVEGSEESELSDYLVQRA